MNIKIALILWNFCYPCVEKQFSGFQINLHLSHIHNINFDSSEADMLLTGMI